MLDITFKSGEDAKDCNSEYYFLYTWAVLHNKKKGKRLRDLLFNVEDIVFENELSMRNRSTGDYVTNEELPIGCKTLLNIAAFPDVCFNVVECGERYIREILKLDKGRVYYPLMDGSDRDYTDEEARAILLREHDKTYIAEKLDRVPERKIRRENIHMRRFEDRYRNYSLDLRFDNDLIFLMGALDGGRSSFAEHLNGYGILYKRPIIRCSFDYWDTVGKDIIVNNLLNNNDDDSGKLFVFDNVDKWMDDRLRRIITNHKTNHQFLLIGEHPEFWQINRSNCRRFQISDGVCRFVPAF